MIHSYDAHIAEHLSLPAAIIRQESTRWCRYNQFEEAAEVFFVGL